MHRALLALTAQVPVREPARRLLGDCEDREPGDPVGLAPAHLGAQVLPHDQVGVAARVAHDRVLLNVRQDLGYALLGRVAHPQKAPVEPGRELLRLRPAHHRGVDHAHQDDHDVDALGLVQAVVIGDPLVHGLLDRGVGPELGGRGQAAAGRADHTDLRSLVEELVVEQAPDDRGRGPHVDRHVLGHQLAAIPAVHALRVLHRRAGEVEEQVDLLARTADRRDQVVHALGVRQIDLEAVDLVAVLVRQLLELGGPATEAEDELCSAFDQSLDHLAAIAAVGADDHASLACIGLCHAVTISFVHIGTFVVTSVYCKKAILSISSARDL